MFARVISNSTVKQSSTLSHMKDDTDFGILVRKAVAERRRSYAGSRSGVYRKAAKPVEEEEYNSCTSQNSSFFSNVSFNSEKSLISRNSSIVSNDLYSLNASPYKECFSNLKRKSIISRESIVTSRKLCLDRHTPRSASITKPRLNINVRGKLFQTFESTLNVFPETLLGNKVYRDAYYDKNSNEYKFDRCLYSFDSILFYYQSKGILSKPGNVARDTFLDEMRFFKIETYLDPRHEEETEYLQRILREDDSPSGYLRSNLWQILEFKQKAIYGRIWYYVSLLTVLCSVFISCAETEDALTSWSPELWFILNSIVAAIFTFEYVLHLYAAPKRMKFMKSLCGVADLTSVLPYYIHQLFYAANFDHKPLHNFVQCLQVVRLFKLIRFSRGLYLVFTTLYECRTHVALLISSIGVTSLTFGTLIYHFEKIYNPVGSTESMMFPAIPDTLWYAVITTTGVGYGDTFPATVLGKLCGAILAILGVLLFCLPTTMLVCKFVECYYLPASLTANVVDEQRNGVVKSMRERFLQDLGAFQS